ncbi:MAG: Hsp33 family molecular chaperone HslO [Armatimonadota bacterium]
MRRNTDILVRALAAGGAVRAFAINSTRLCDRARRAQGSLPAATAALGRLMSAAAMLSATIKEGERISLRIEGDGPVGSVFAQATPDGRVRGYIQNPQVNPPSKGDKLDVGRAVGQHGMMYVVRDLGMSEPYVGSAELQTGEIGDDLAYYFAVSDQQPSAVGLGVLVQPDNSVSAAGGYIIQPLPGAPQEVIDRLEANILAAPRPSDLIINLREPEKMLDVLLAGMDWQELERTTPRFYCGCTRTKSRTALRALSVEDLQTMIATGESAHVACDFCARNYEFPPEEMKQVLERKVKGR